MTFTVVIATFNRADDLRGTLDSIATLRPNATWEVIVVDNNSSDGTRQAVEAAAAAFPAPLRYMAEYEQGRSPALNAAIARAQGDIIVTTDDDVRVEPDWLDRAAEALERLGPDHVGGRVVPIWGGPPPAGLPHRSGKHLAVIALLDYRPAPIAFSASVPLGVKLAFPR